jgi:hypothetical protein
VIFVGGAQPRESACTSQQTWPNGPPGGATKLFDLCDGLGHINWAWITYEANAYWGSHDKWDDDYNLHLVRSDQAGYTQNRPDILLTEFDSDLTIDHFDDPENGWWHQFHNAVDESKRLGGDKEAVSRFLNGKYLVALGVLGLEAAKGSKAELHSIVAMAVHVKSELNDDVWAFFAMRFGNEGGCGGPLEIFPSPIITLPLFRPATTDVEITQEYSMCECDNGIISRGLPKKPGLGAVLWFKIPEPKLLRGFFTVGSLIYGEIHLTQMLQQEVDLVGRHVG